MKPKALILRTAGTNCDKETELAFQKAGARTVLRHLNYIKTDTNLSDYQIIAIPGGFSYGDDLGAGKIFALELTLWLAEQLKAFIQRKGLIIGICNGFQILVKTGILPDLDFKQKVTLTFNNSGKFEDRWVYLKVTRRSPRGDSLGASKSLAPRRFAWSEPVTSAEETKDQRPQNKEQKEEIESRKKKIESVWLAGMPEVISLPVAHGEGKFYANKSVLDTLEKNGQVALRYVDAQGNASGYPLNPNGSCNDIAGITDATGRVLGLMPHPERFIYKHHWPFWKEKAVSPFGLEFFRNAVTHC